MTTGIPGFEAWNDKQVELLPATVSLQLGVRKEMKLYLETKFLLKRYKNFEPLDYPQTINYLAQYSSASSNMSLAI